MDRNAEQLKTTGLNKFSRGKMLIGGNVGEFSLWHVELFGFE